MAEVFNLRGLRWMKGWSDLIGIKQSGLFSKGREGAWAFLFGGGEYLLIFHWKGKEKS